MNLDKQQVSQRIKSIRTTLGMTMESFGKQLDTSKGAVNNWEKGKSLPNNERLKIIAELGNISVNELLYGSIEAFRYSLIKQLYERNMIETGMKVDKEELYRYIGGTEFINEVYEQVEKEQLGYDDRDKIVRTFKMMYNRRLFSFLAKKSKEKEKLDNSLHTVNLNLVSDYFERKSKLEAALKENDEHNANNKLNMIPFDPSKFERVPTIVLDDTPLTDDEIARLNELIAKIKTDRSKL